MAADPAVGRADAHPLPGSAPEAYAARLFERHGDRVLAYCRRRLATLEEAEDALQTTFLYACRGLRRGVVPQTEVAWLLKIAHNVCLSHWDTNRRRRRLELVKDPDQLAAAAPAPAGSRDELHALEAALADLTDQQRSAIVLREWRGLSYGEIAAELGLSHSAVEALIFRARRALANSLELQDVGTSTRARIARALDFGGLLAALKSALGGGTAAKVAATGLVVGASLLPSGSAPEVASREAAPPRPSPPLVVSAPTPPVVDPATLPDARAAAAVRRDVPRKPAAEEPRAKKRAERRPQPTPSQPAESGTQPPTLGETVGQVATGVGGTVGTTLDAVTGTVGGVVQTATGTVERTVQTLPEVVDPTLDVVGGVLDGNGKGGLLGQDSP